MATAAALATSSPNPSKQALCTEVTALGCGLAFVNIASIALFVIGCVAAAGAFPGAQALSGCSISIGATGGVVGSVLAFKTLKKISISQTLMTILPSLSFVILGSLDLTGVLQVRKIGWGILGTVGGLVIIKFLKNAPVKNQISIFREK